MNKLLSISFAAFFILLIYGCSSNSYVYNKTNNLVYKLQLKSDTIYSFSSNDLTFLWYYKDDDLYSILIRPFKTKKYRAVKSKNIPLNKDDINVYFEISLTKDIPCFYESFDGESIKIYIKNQKALYSGIDIECLFNKKYERNSFPYKLQFELSKIIRPKDYYFEDMYKLNEN